MPLSAAQSLARNIDSGKPLPRIPELHALYNRGVTFRHGQVIMIAGRSGTQKSGFALWLAARWNLPTLYFSADMSAFTASARLASMLTGHTTEMVESGMASGRRDYYLDRLNTLNMQLSFGSPITWNNVNQELNAYVELWDSLPQVMVFDNVMDFDGAESDYKEQMAVVSSATDLTRDTGATVILLHHATDKSWDARSDPWNPPNRAEVKNGLAEKPELTLTVGLDPHSFYYKVACVKQRMGPSDPTAQTWALLRARPDVTRFEAMSLEEGAVL